MSSLTRFSRVVYLTNDKKFYVVFDVDVFSVRLQSKPEGMILESHVKIPNVEVEQYQKGYDLRLMCPTCNFCICELNEFVVDSRFVTYIEDFDCDKCEKKRIRYPLRNKRKI